MKKWQNIILVDLLIFIIFVSINRYFIVAFICIVIHELTHILMAKRKGVNFSNLQVNVYGANVQLLELDELSDNDRFLVYISGPLINIVIGGIIAIFYIYWPLEFLKNIVEINLGLAIFNLMPAYPLDGARIMEIILSRKISFKKSQRIISIFSYVIALFFMFIAIVSIINKNNINITIFISSVITAYITYSERKRMMYILMGSIFKKRQNLIKNKYIENKTISVYYKQGLVNLLSLVEKNKFNTFYVLDDDMKIRYIIHEDELISGLKEFGNISLEEYEKIR